MSWEQRLREMVLAGGALAVTACGGATDAQVDAAASEPTRNAGDDDSSVLPATLPSTTPTTAPTNGPPTYLPEAGCCNASPDPCCARGCLDGWDAASYVTCEQTWTACEAMGGSYPDLQSLYPDGGLVCVIPDAGVEGGPIDAGPSDAEPDQGSPVISFCCNANPDPCCPIAYCAGGAGPDAAVYITCEQNRTQCESANGNYTHQLDGSLGCTPTSVSGH